MSVRRCIGRTVRTLVGRLLSDMVVSCTRGASAVTRHATARRDHRPGRPEPPCGTLGLPRRVRIRAPPGSAVRDHAAGAVRPPDGVRTRTMFDTLSERLRKTLGSLTGRGRISEADVDAAMREVRLALVLPGGNGQRRV